MNPAETLIRTMATSGCSAKRIAEVLFDQDMRNDLGRTYTQAMVEGFLRYAKLDDVQLMAAHKNRLSQDDSTAAPMAPAVGKDTGQSAPSEEEPVNLKHPGMRREWPTDTDYRPDNLSVRD